MLARPPQAGVRFFDDLAPRLDAPGCVAMNRIYLDHNATTPIGPAAAEAMKPWLEGRTGNPGALHAEGRAARRAVEEARDQVAHLLGADPAEIVFTSGATEGNTTAVRGYAGRSPGPLRPSAVEHASVLEAAAAAVGRDRVETLPVDGQGRALVDACADALRRPTAAVFVMAANNETGAVQPIHEIGDLCAARGISFHVDAVQAVGRIAFRLPAGATSAVISAHKIGGPQGVGALWIRRGVRMPALFHGGGQERERRAGTESVAGCVGFGVAATEARRDLADRSEALRAAEAAWCETLSAIGVQWSRNGPADPERRLPGTVSLRCPGRSGEGLVLGLDLAGVAVGLGAACSSGSARPSFVLAAMGLPKEEVLESFRVSFGAGTRPEESEEAARVLGRILRGAG